MDSKVKMSPIPVEEYHMTLKEFKENCESKYLTDKDGFGKLATATEVSNIDINPSDKEKKDLMFTHVVWYYR